MGLLLTANLAIMWPVYSVTYLQFSNQFEVYEQHCALESLNLRTLNTAMENKDFRTYLEVIT